MSYQENINSAAGSAYMPGSNYDYAQNARPPLESYRLNVDPNPMVVNRPTPPVQQTTNINVRLLKPPPQRAGDIVVHQEQDVQLPAAPPLHIRQQAQSPAQHTRSQYTHKNMQTHTYIVIAPELV